MKTENTAIEVCLGPECGGFGGPELLQALTEHGLKVLPGHCLGLCHYAPVATVARQYIGDATLGKVLKKIEHT